MSKSRLPIATLGLLVAAAFLLSACGSSSGGDSTTSGAKQQSGSLEKVKEEVARLEERPTSVGIKTPISKPIPANKVIDSLTCPLPGCVEAGEHFQEAGEAVGWKVNTINTGLTPEEVKAAWEKAVRDKPDAVVSGTGFPVQIYQSQLSQLQASKIPVVELTQGEPAKGVFSILGPERFELNGRVMAKWAIANSDGEANVLYVNSGFPAFELEQSSFEKEIAANCPSCSVSYYLAPETSIGKDLAGNVAQRVQANPGTNTIVTAYADMINGVEAALKGAGVTGVIGVTQGQSTSLTAPIRQGELPQGLFLIPVGEVAWRAVDLLIRDFNGESTAEDTNDATIPQWFVNKENIPPGSEPYSAVVNYEEQFEELWGLK